MLDEMRQQSASFVIYMYTKIDAKNSFKEYNSLDYNQCAGILTRNSIQGAAKI